MAKTVTLGTLWLNSAALPSDRMTFPYMAALKVTPTVSGEVRRYAGNVLVASSRLGRARSVAASLPWCSREQVAWLEAHAGQAVCVRDDRGRRFFAVYWQVPTAERGGQVEADVDLAFDEVTVNEAV